MNKYCIILGLSFLCFNCKQKQDIPSKISVRYNWTCKNANDTMWLSATVPGDVYSDLLKHKIIENPFVKDNALKLQWVSASNWEYKTTFILDEATLQKKHLELNFEGLDTYASVFLNDSLILKTNNAFRQWNVEVKSMLKAENKLRIVFEKTSNTEAREKAKIPYELPEGNRIFTRKAQFQYG